MARLIPDEQAALLAAIGAAPDDDTLRLVYADWLQERGDEEQARFIRDWIALDGLSEYEDEKRETIALQLDGVAERNGARWLVEVGVENAEPAYDRGMVEEVIYTSFEKFRADAPLLFAQTPVRAVTIQSLGWCDNESEPLPELAAMSELARLNALRLSNEHFEVDTDDWAQFMASPFLANLRELSVRDAGLTDSDVGPLTHGAPLVHLEELGLSGNRFTAAGALAIVRSPRLPNLKRLGLAYNDIRENRRRGSPYLALRDALIDRFDSASALSRVV